MKHARRFGISVCIATILSGCAQYAPPREQAPNVATTEPVLCVSKAQCDVFWKRAEAWVANNSIYPLRTITDTIIETNGPITAQTRLAFRITRVPDDKEGARIYVLASCGSTFGCNPPAGDAVIAFRRFVAN